MSIKIQIFSDLHFEFMTTNKLRKQFVHKLKTGADIAIVAGDLGTRQCFNDSVEILLAAYEKVIFVPGNHEYYFSSPKEMLFKFKRQANKNPGRFFYLDDNMVEIEGQRFIGSTLWFYDLGDNWRFSNSLSDFQVIGGFPTWVYDKNKASMDYLEDNVKEGDIVITHHMPTYNSVSPQYRHSELNRFFVCDMKNLISTAKPRMWIHGHTHDSFDYTMEESTRIICNPYGYRGRNVNMLFDYGLVVNL